MISLPALPGSPPSGPAGPPLRPPGRGVVPAPFRRGLARYWGYRSLVYRLTQREVLGRYRGSRLGVLWTLLNPLLTLAVFSVVFGVIFHGKFTGHPTEGPADYALALFSGLILFNLLAECLGRAPGLVLGAPSLVTKVIFPLEILPVTMVLGAAVHLAISFLPLVVGVGLLRGHLPATILLWPLLLVPALSLSLGLSWLLSALGVFLRDLGQLMATVNLVLMYLSAIFYPLSRVPAGVRPFVQANPLAFLAESSRNLAVWGTLPDWGQYAWCCLVGLTVMGVGFTFFVRVKHAFADVL